MQVALNEPTLSAVLVTQAESLLSYISLYRYYGLFPIRLLLAGRLSRESNFVLTKFRWNIFSHSPCTLLWRCSVWQPMWEGRVHGIPFRYFSSRVSSPFRAFVPFRPATGGFAPVPWFHVETQSWRNAGRAEVAIDWAADITRTAQLC